MAVEARFNMPGLRQNFPLNMLIVALLEQHPEMFREGVKITSIYGEFPTSLWNGGRPSNYDQCSADYVTNVIKTINSKGISVRYTYTNMVLSEEDCLDEYCNFCLKQAQDGPNGIIIFSEILENYIRKNYPSFHFVSSTCKQIRDIDKLNEELRKDYFMVVPDYNFSNNWELLNKIEDKSRCELLVNALCEPNCPRRGDHYRNIAENQRIMLKNRKMPKDKQIPLKKWWCEYGEYNCVYTIQNYRTYISPEDIWEKYIPAGFTNFKIEGRTGNLFSLVETYTHYLIKPEYQGQVRIQLLNNLATNKILSINRMRPQQWVNPEKTEQ